MLTVDKCFHSQFVDVSSKNMNMYYGYGVWWYETNDAPIKK